MYHVHVWRKSEERKRKKEKKREKRKEKTTTKNKRKKKKKKNSPENRSIQNSTILDAHIIICVIRMSCIPQTPISLDLSRP